MLDLIAGLAAGSRVLDLGAASGSFDSPRHDLQIVRVDAEIPASRLSGSYVAADAAHLPLAGRSFDLVVSNHSLEHFDNLAGAIREMGRVAQPGGTLYIAVPDANTLTDRIYRWLGRGGGHVNAFRSPEEVASAVERGTGMRLRATRVLYSSLSFLNRHNFKTRPPRKIALFGFGSERFLAILMWLLRMADQSLGTRLSHYGWSFYFDRDGAASPPRLEAWPNVCVRCGSGHSEDFLRREQIVPSQARAIQSYRCPACGGWNLFSPSRE